MRNRRSSLVAPVVVAVLVAVAAASASAATDIREVGAGRSVEVGEVGRERLPYAPGEVIVHFDRGTSAGERRAARRAVDGRFRRSLRLPQAQVVQVEGGVLAAVERLERQEDVAVAQPNYRYQALATAPDDTFFASLWGLQDTSTPNPGVNILSAWDSSRGDGQLIAVLDTGVALDHPDLQGNLWTGGVGGSAGRDFVDGDDVPDDYDYHGTHVAGTAAAIADNGLGVAGVAPNAEVMAVRVLDGNGSGFTDDIADGIAYAAQNGADVINLSLGGPAGVEDAALSDAVGIADDLDAVVVAAAGNDGRDNDAVPTMPCALPHANLLCVAAVSQSGGLAGFSNFGRVTVDVAAPGTNIVSAQPDYATVFSNGLDAGTGWATGVLDGGVPWDLVTSPRTQGTMSAADSPSGLYGQATDPDFFAQSILVRQSGVDLSGRSGCRMRFDLRRELEDGYDYLFAGATDDVEEEGLFFTGSSNGSFFGEEVSLSAFDGQASVKPEFVVLSDAVIELDGVYVDDLSLLCRDDSYADALAPSGNYVAFQGTSMATPHVAGVAALLGAADPAAPDSEIVQAIKTGVVQLPSLSCVTVSGGTVDAAAALAAVLALPGSPPPVSDSCPTPPPSGGGTTTTAPPPAPTSTPLRPLVAADLSGAPAKLRVTRARRLVYRFRATPGLRGRAVLRTAKRVIVPTRRGAVRRHVTLAKPRFGVGPGGTVRLRVRLSVRELRVLRRNRRLTLRVVVTVRDQAGRTATTRKRLVLLAPR